MGRALRQWQWRDITWEDASPESPFEAAPTRHLFQWWLGFAPDLPRRADFDILDHASIATHLFLYRRIGPGHFERQIAGEHVRDALGAHIENRIASARSAHPYERELAEHLEARFDRRRCRRVTGMLAPMGRGHVRIESVECPLVSPSGAPSHVIGALARLPVSAGR